ncbi:MAG: hypothetical protein A4E55_00582 [Pelotomaculum sp. PtaU1.Bin035]|nr:MAG: hypothetical protein A4E55_00582 [Pelotomaculum sp. PtaU1.Bin035]
MRAVLNYKHAGFNKTKTILFTALLLTIAFFLGAMAEKSAHILQDIMVITPEALNEIKTFFSDKIILKVNTVTGCLKWGSIITISIFEHSLSCLIRGP